MRTAGRVSWELYIGQIPSDRWVLHRCNNVLCVNPNHLYLGTRLDNAADAIKAGLYYSGTKNGNSKLTDEDIEKIKISLKNGIHVVSLAALYKVGRHTISRIKKGLKHGTPTTRET